MQEICVALFLIYILISLFLLRFLSQRSVTLRNRILIVISHPDDECMFFGPTIFKLRSKSELHLICFSVGDADGLGNVRRNELFCALKRLGIDKDNVLLVDDSKFKDGMNEKWDKEAISKIVERFIIDHNIESVITFDKIGITYHANHIAVYEGVRLVKPRLKNVDMFVLDSVPIFRKFLSVLELPVSFATVSSTKHGKKLFVISFSDYKQLLGALHEHSSQMVWFRILYSLFSRYMFINTVSQLSN